MTERQRALLRGRKPPPQPKPKQQTKAEPTPFHYEASALLTGCIARLIGCVVVLAFFWYLMGWNK